MIARILITLDGSGLSEQALPMAARLAELAAADLRLIHVLDFVSPIPHDTQSPDDWRGCASGDADCYLETVASRLAQGDRRRIATALRKGDSVAGILEEAREWRADLIVLATHGHGGIRRARLGSVADAVIRNAHVPVLLVRAGRIPSFQRFEHILIPLEPAPFSQQILAPAMELARMNNAHVTILHVAHPWVTPIPMLAPAMGSYGNLYGGYAAMESAKGQLGRVRDSLEGSAQNVTAEVLPGQGAAARDILDFAHSRHADLIALATRGRSGLARVLLGSTADEIVRSADVPVLVLRP